jgi:hypothetical protein
VLLGVSVIVVLLQSRKSGTAVVLRTTAALLIAEVLASIGGEEPWNIDDLVRHVKS